VRDRTSGALEHQQARRAAFGRRFLGDQFSGKIEVEVADIHVRRSC
jgi:hypothetical protein